LIRFSLLAGIAAAAYLIKGLTGFGPAIVFISLGSLVMDPARVVAVSPLLDIAAGGILIWKDKSIASFRYWSTLTLPLIAGVVAGAWGFRSLSGALYGRILGLTIVGLGLWFVLRKIPGSLITANTTGPGQPAQDPPGTPPLRPEPGAMIAAGVSGITGGLFGISGPPLIWYFGSRYPRRMFRRIIVPLFLVEAVVRTCVYAALGVLHREEWGIALGLLPAMLIGLMIGNHWFNVIPQHRFERVIGGVLILSGIKLFLG